MGETDPNQELKGEVRWVVRKVTEGAENRKDPRTGMERRTQRGRKLKAAKLSTVMECGRREVKSMVW